ncbi:hypothetical protein DID75_02520 [Candidatus Marinamargulisbacteria bacterium SCGC AG-410-N11]|nr:hypothetical protein DID75_02520 [Candidatus Marinamargulisbacteria bacterium SCGC AG-410-N11]
MNGLFNTTNLTQVATVNNLAALDAQGSTDLTITQAGSQASQDSSESLMFNLDLDGFSEMSTPTWITILDTPQVEVTQNNETTASQARERVSSPPIDIPAPRCSLFSIDRLNNDNSSYNSTYSTLKPYISNPNFYTPQDDWVFINFERSCKKIKTTSNPDQASRSIQNMIRIFLAKRKLDQLKLAKQIQDDQPFTPIQHDCMSNESNSDTQSLSSEQSTETFTSPVPSSEQSTAPSTPPPTRVNSKHTSPNRPAKNKVRKTAFSGKVDLFAQQLTTRLLKIQNSKK